MKSFNEIIYDVTKFGRKIKTSDYMGNGKYPIIDQGKNLISGYTNEENGIIVVMLPSIIYAGIYLVFSHGLRKRTIFSRHL